MLDKLIDGGPQMLLAMAALRLVSEGLLRISEAVRRFVSFFNQGSANM